MTQTLYLFPDTNVLEQCRPLDKLNWSGWGDFDEIHLIISRPVQTEIDEHKSKGGERLARKARKASSLLREIILGGSDHKIVQASAPCVRLFIKTAIRPSQELADILDYDRPDDQFVGTAHAFLHQNPDLDVRILTHDTGPMASAQMIGIAIAAVPDDWLLPSEPSEYEKRISLLESELARRTKTEPELNIACIDIHGNKLDKLELEVLYHEPLSDEDVVILIEQLKIRIPIATDYGPRERIERPGHISMQFLGLKEVFTPATEKDIEQYRDKYGKWLKQCEDVLRSFHAALQQKDGPPIFIFAATNNGIRPADDALITISAQGRFRIMPPPIRAREDHEEADKADEGTIGLPKPPDVPRGSWKSGLGAIDSFFAMHKGFGIGTIDRMLLPNDLYGGLRPHLPATRDPNSFYYKPGRPQSPSSEFSLECKQWRHGVDVENFEGQIHFDEKLDNIAGALECRIHAKNLSQSTAILIPVRIQVKRVKTFVSAQEIVNRI
jgi:hypothetical protein